MVDQISTYVQPAQVIFALLNNSINILTLCQRSRRQSPGTHYLIGHTVFNHLYRSIAVSIQALRRFGILPMNSLVGCKLQPYMVFTFPSQAAFMPVLASIDRLCNSSSSMHIRAFSSSRIVRVAISTGTIVYAFYMCPFFAIYYYVPTTNQCFQYSDTLTITFISSWVSIYYIIVPSMMTICNIRQQLRRVYNLLFQVIMVDVPKLNYFACC